MALDLIAVFAAMVCIISPAESICQQIGNVQNPWTNLLRIAGFEYLRWW
jgi:hypothetical protein